MNEQLVQRIKNALRKSWSSDTCSIFEKEYPYYGQCGQTAIVIYEKFGGNILKTKGWPNQNGNGRHFYNRINGIMYDFTAEQFTDIPDYTFNMNYEDILSSAEEAETETNKQQIASLMYAFNKEFDDT